jgi:NAD(P)-dependent dehydrogenase (short-subunit alcohol dehydrogenase family)
MELTISENFLATAVVVQLVLDAMVKAGGGRIVLVTSQASTAGGTDALYAAAKAGLVALVKSVAREFSRFGVLCNAVSPGPVDTPMATVMGPELRRDYEHRIPIGRFASPSEVGEVIVFLLMMEGGAISGATIDVDGGLIRR